MRSPLAPSILLVGLLLGFLSVPTTAQKTRLGVDNNTSSGSTALLGQPAYAFYGEHSSGNVGTLGSSFYGASAAHNNGNFGWLGGSDSGAYGIHFSSANYGYLGGTDYGVYGQNSNGDFGTLGGYYGAYGQNSNGNYGFLGGVYEGAFGYHNNGHWGSLGTPTYAGYFKGDVHITGTLTGGSAAFKVDHPLDPANQYLVHSAVESPDMKNVYDGTVTTDGNGSATVTLPSYFEVLNRDFRYQLTAIGAPGPNLYIAEKISGNRFKIAGGEPGMEVSWQVTGIRQDVWANENRVVVEEAKPAEERGYYLYPALYGQPAERSVAWARDPEGMREIQEMPARIEEERRRMEAERQQIELEHQRLEEERQRLRKAPRREE